MFRNDFYKIQNRHNVKFNLKVGQQRQSKTRHTAQKQRNFVHPRQHTIRILTQLEHKTIAQIHDDQCCNQSAVSISKYWPISIEYLNLKILITPFSQRRTRTIKSSNVFLIRAFSGSHFICHNFSKQNAFHTKIPQYGNSQNISSLLANLNNFFK